MNHFLMISKLEMKTVLGLFLLVIALACNPEKENSKGGEQSQNSQISLPFKEKQGRRYYGCWKRATWKKTGSNY